MKTLFIKTILLCCLFFSAEINAQELNPKLANAFEHTLDSMKQVLSVNGLSGAIQLSDDAIWAAGSGISTFLPLDSLSSEHTFATGSTAKTITAMCVLQMVDEGILSLEDSLHHWLPSYEHVDSTVTIQQLLQHKSGIADFLQNPIFQPTLFQNPEQIWTADEALIQFMQPPAFQPGTFWGYSNTNYVLLGMIIEAATGNSFEAELENRFFKPLGLDSFANPAFDAIAEPYAHLWLDITGDGMVDDAGEFITNWLSLFSIVGPATGYFASPTDLAIWIKKSMSGSLVNADTWAWATQSVPTTLPNNIAYGLGLMESNYLGYTAYGHGGDLSYSTQALYFPALDISIVVNSNDARITSWNLITTVRALLQVYIDCTEINTSVENTLQAQINATVFPNPFDEELQITIDSPISIWEAEMLLFSMDGKLVWNNKNHITIGRNDLSFPLPKELPSGLYYLQIKSPNTIVEQKLIVKK